VSKLKSKTSEKKQQCQQASIAELESMAEEKRRYSNDCLSSHIALRILQLAFRLQDMNTPTKKARTGQIVGEREGYDDATVSECMWMSYCYSITRY
jgi:hypothetical protein